MVQRAAAQHADIGGQQPHHRKQPRGRPDRVAASEGPSKLRAPLDISFCDFGATRYRLQTVGGGEGTAGVFRLSVSLPGYAELHKLGLHEHLKEQLGPAAALVAAEAGFDLAVEVARDGLSGVAAARRLLTRA